MEHEPLPAASGSEIAELKAQYNSLHSILVSLLLLMIVVSGTLWLYLMRQAKYAKVDLSFTYISYTNTVAQAERMQPAIEQTVKKFQDFARTNPDFAPIFAKYIPQSALATAATSAPPKTAKAPGKK